MRILKLITLVGLGVALSATANAQFSVSGAGAAIPASGSGGGGTWDTVMPPSPSVSTVAVPVGVTSIDSIVIDGFAHTWAGDLQVTLADPSGVEHLVFVRPGYLNTSGAGTAGDFMGGTYTFVESGGLSLPTASDGVDIPPGTYNQTFDTGGVVWVSGTNNIFNTPMSTIAGAAGNWTLTIYDWAAGDTGSFSGWTLNGNGGSGGPGTEYCAEAVYTCPCFVTSAIGEGCPNSTGTGATMAAAGSPSIGASTFSLTAAQLPDTVGLFVQGTSAIGGVDGNPVGEGRLCLGPQKRYQPQAIAGGTVSRSNFENFATAGGAMNYQFWYRDPSNTCAGGGFNFTPAYNVTWLP